MDTCALLVRGGQSGFVYGRMGTWAEQSERSAVPYSRTTESTVRRPIHRGLEYLNTITLLMWSLAISATQLCDTKRQQLTCPSPLTSQTRLHTAQFLNFQCFHFRCRTVSQILLSCNATREHYVNCFSLGKCDGFMRWTKFGVSEYRFSGSDTT
jgi:hypothetical protein